MTLSFLVSDLTHQFCEIKSFPAPIITSPTWPRDTMRRLHDIPEEAEETVPERSKEKSIKESSGIHSKAAISTRGDVTPFLHLL